VNPNPKLKNVLTIGIYGGHAFVIKDIAKLAKTYACTHCGQRFTKTCHLQHHHQTCSSGKTVIYCPGTKVEAPQTAFKRVMYPNSTASRQALLWLEREAKQRGIHIHHTICGHGGKRWLPRGGRTMKASPVDSYNPETRTVFQYHASPFHGCPKCFPHHRQQESANNGKTPEQLYQATLNRTALLRESGYKVIEAWSCEVGLLKGELPRNQTKTYPHAIWYDFEAYGDKNYRKEPTGALTIENAHVPISVSVGDTLEREPTHICERDPAKLVCKFMKELERQEKNIEDQVLVEFVQKTCPCCQKSSKKSMNGATRFLSSGSTQAAMT